MNTECGKLTEISSALADSLNSKNLGGHVFRVGEVIKIEGKVGTYKVTKLGNKFITLRVLPVIE